MNPDIRGEQENTATPLLRQIDLHKMLHGALFFFMIMSVEKESSKHVKED